MKKIVPKKEMREEIMEDDEPIVFSWEKIENWFIKKIKYKYENNRKKTLK